ncbi:hypothetical protein [Nocardia lasii]|uniref:Uncharacterized protein n=1 Tax=Nocardia lasii TaxID=1616107 RepID=A0ABW1K0T7_9NOCA
MSAAMDHELIAKYAGALGDPDNSWRKPSPIGDQIDAAMQPDQFLNNGDHIWRSLWWAYCPRVEVAVMAARLVPTTIPDLKALTNFGLVWELSNLPNRRPMDKPLPGNYVNELIPALRAEALDRGIAVHDELSSYAAALEAATTGPVGLRTVVVYGADAFFYSFPLAFQHFRISDNDAGTYSAPALSAWPVPDGWTCERVARFVARSVHTCHWCEKQEAGAFALMVTCGAQLRVFPTCTHCQMDLDGEYRPLLDWMHLYDDWDRRTNYPADKYR